jgi:Flp pilus assembly protein TadD
MGRSRRRFRHDGMGGLGDNYHPPESEDYDGPGAALSETLQPTYVPMRDGRLRIVAPVLELDGLEPWAEIAGPALALDESCDDEMMTAACCDPAQLELQPVVAVEVAPPESLASLASPDMELFEPQAPEPVQACTPEPTPDPDPVEQLYADARAATEEGRREAAKALYRQIVALDPVHVRARNNLALLLDADGGHEAALAELDRALEVEPDNGTLLVNRGALLGAMGRHAAAERDLRRVLRTEPAHAEALFNLGVVMTKKALWSEAVPHLQRALELEPGRAAAQYYLGEALNHVDDLAGALIAYQRAAELQPSNPRALYGLGIIYDRLARPDDAARMYRRARQVGRR